jgi:hypothetical protein
MDLIDHRAGFQELINRRLGCSAIPHGSHKPDVVDSNVNIQRTLEAFLRDTLLLFRTIKQQPDFAVRVKFNESSHRILLLPFHFHNLACAHNIPP